MTKEATYTTGQAVSTLLVTNHANLSRRERKPLHDGPDLTVDTKRLSSVSPPLIQPKLKIGAPNDKYEQEADRVADKVMRMPESDGVDTQNAAPQIQRMCSNCEKELQRQTIDDEEEEELLQTRAEAGHTPQLNTDTAAQIRNLKGGGQPLEPSTRTFMESRFGKNFSEVRVHADNSAASLASGIHARAFTHGRDIVFGQGEYSPQSTTGRKLIAHELTHVVQQGKSNSLAGNIQRTYSSRSRCRSGSATGAPPMPDVFLTLTEIVLGGKLTNTIIGLIFDIQSLQAGTRPQTSRSFNAYLTRFGPPERLSNGKYRDRFTRQQFNSEDAAMLSELTQIKIRLERVQRFFNGPIRYICATRTQWLTIGNCRGRCADENGDAFAWVCHTGGAPRTIVICPDFWGMSGDDQAVGLIHEACHLLFRFGDPQGSSMTTRRRGRNPVCFSGFVASVSGHNPPDTDCPPV